MSAVNDEDDKNKNKKGNDDEYELKICCLGAGYAGGPSMVVIAKMCPHIRVSVIDSSKERIDLWNSNNSNNLPIYEPGLIDAVNECRGKNLFFFTSTTASSSTDNNNNDNDNDDMIKKEIDDADIIFIAVNTPTKSSGIGAGRALDIQNIELCARQIATASTTNKIIVEKSTVPIKTADAIRHVLNVNKKKTSKNIDNEIKFEVISNPDFLAEGNEFTKRVHPNRVLIGCNETPDGQKAANVLVNIYANWIPRERILKSNIWSSELSKLASNVMLAQRVSTINAFSALCEVTGADVTDISTVVGKDERIGNKFLNASIGFGGSGFQKDIHSLVYICESYGLYECADYFNQIVSINNYQKKRFSEIMVSKMLNTVTGKKITIFGFAFKKDTGDVRETPSANIVHDLLKEDSIIHVYDPQVKREDMMNELIKKSNDNNVNNNQLLSLSSSTTNNNGDSSNHSRNSSISSYHNHKNNGNNTIDYDSLLTTSNTDPYTACVGSHAIAILTCWDEFMTLDYKRIYKSMMKPAYIFDGHNLLSQHHNELRQIGFDIYSIGRPQ